MPNTEQVKPFLLPFLEHLGPTKGFVAKTMQQTVQSRREQQQAPESTLKHSLLFAQVVSYNKKENTTI